VRHRIEKDERERCWKSSQIDLSKRLCFSAAVINSDFYVFVRLPNKYFGEPRCKKHTSLLSIYFSSRINLWWGWFIKQKRSNMLTSPFCRFLCSCFLCVANLIKVGRLGDLLAERLFNESTRGGSSWCRRPRDLKCTPITLQHSHRQLK